jgi:hypothetical protein
MATGSALIKPNTRSTITGDFGGAVIVDADGNIQLSSGKLIRDVTIESSYKDGYSTLFLRNLFIMVLAGFHFKIVPIVDKDKPVNKWAVRGWYSKNPNDCSDLTVYRWSRPTPNHCEFDKDSMANMDLSFAAFKGAGVKVQVSRISTRKVYQWFLYLAKFQIGGGADVGDGLDPSNQYVRFVPMCTTTIVEIQEEADPMFDDEEEDQRRGTGFNSTNGDQGRDAGMTFEQLSQLPLQNWPEPLRKQYEQMTATGNKKFAPNNKGPNMRGPKESAFDINREIQKACQKVGKHQLYIAEADLLTGYQSHIICNPGASKDMWLKQNKDFALAIGLRQGRAVITAGLKVAIRNNADKLVEILATSRQQTTTNFTPEEIEQRSMIYKAMQVKNLSSLAGKLQVAEAQFAMVSAASIPNPHDILHARKQVAHFYRLVRETEVKVRNSQLPSTGGGAVNENCVPYLVFFYQIVHTIQEKKNGTTADAIGVAGKFCHIVSCTELTSGQTKSWRMIKALTTELRQGGTSIVIQELATAIEEKYVFTTDAVMNTPPTTITPGRIARCSAFILNDKACNPFCISGMDPAAQIGFVVRLFEMERRASRLLNNELGSTLAPLILHHILKDRITPAILPENKMSLQEIIDSIEHDTLVEAPRDITGLHQRAPGVRGMGSLNVWDNMVD